MVSAEATLLSNLFLHNWAFFLGMFYAFILTNYMLNKSWIMITIRAVTHILIVCYFVKKKIFQYLIPLILLLINALFIINNKICFIMGFIAMLHLDGALYENYFVGKIRSHVEQVSTKRKKLFKLQEVLIIIITLIFIFML